MNELDLKRIKEVNQVKVVYTFDVAYVGWECDSTGWVALDDRGDSHIILTNHGSPYVANIKKMKDLISSYINLIDKTNRAIDCFDDGRGDK